MVYIPVYTYAILSDKAGLWRHHRVPLIRPVVGALAFEVKQANETDEIMECIDGGACPRADRAPKAQSLPIGIDPMLLESITDMGGHIAIEQPTGLRVLEADAHEHGDSPHQPEVDVSPLPVYAARSAEAKTTKTDDKSTTLRVPIAAAIACAQDRHFSISPHS